MSWAYIAFVFVAMIAIGGVIWEELRARFGSGSQPGPLSGLTKGEALLLALLLAAPLFGVAQAIQNVLT